MSIREFDPASPADVDGWLEVTRAAQAVDVPDFPPPCRDDFIKGLAAPRPGESSRRWLAEENNQVLGTLRLGFQELDNWDNVDLELTVHPEARRRGIGTALHEAAVAEVRQAGRKRLMSESVRALPDGGGPQRVGAGSLFAPRTGAKLGQTEIRRRQDLSRVDRTALLRRLAELTGRAAGYALQSWTGPAPDDVVAGIATLDSRFLGEAPLGELAWEPQRVDVERVRAGERSAAARGRRMYHTVARHEATGEIVGWTTLGFEHCPADHAFQQITLVLPEHRGHRLGLLVKLANLVRTWAAEPALSTIDTWNAQENTHMIAVNEAMGFRPVDAWDAWQLEI
jgi:GNAT superfamily N-acetyltransferase